MKDLKFENETQSEKISLLEQAIRDITMQSSDNYDDSYEAVLRSEFELMRKKFEIQVSNLKNENSDQLLKFQIENRNLQNEI